MKKTRKLILIILTMVIVPLSYATKVLNQNQFIERLVNVDHFNRQYVKYTLSQAKPLNLVVKKMNHPAEKRDWDWYRHFFIKPDRIQLGVQYWQQHQAMLQQAAKRYGVNPSVIVSIIGIETLYGQHQGQISALNSLYTLAFTHKNRVDFFQRQLESYFILCRKLNLNILNVKGSYAGALGIPQFMPSIYLALAKSNNKHQPNLFSNQNDAILSVANYLHVHHWTLHEPIIARTLIKAKPKVNFMQPKPTHSVSWYKKHHVKLMTFLWPHSKATLIKLDTKARYRYWLASRNFFSILSYNNSKNYGMAVYVLSRKIREQYYGHHHA